MKLDIYDRRDRFLGRWELSESALQALDKVKAPGTEFQCAPTPRSDRTRASQMSFRTARRQRAHEQAEIILVALDPATAILLLEEPGFTRSAE